MNVRIQHGRNGTERTRGVTFTEMLVVLSLVILMGALVVPAFYRSRELAQQATCLDNIHRLGIAWQMLRKDADGEWTRARCDGGRYKPQAMADLAALGYVEDAVAVQYQDELPPQVTAQSPEELDEVFGANVVLSRRTGWSMKPVSSIKTMLWRLRRAFFYTRPVPFAPAADLSDTCRPRATFACREQSLRFEARQPREVRMPR